MFQIKLVEHFSLFYSAIAMSPMPLSFIMQTSFLANVNSRSRSLYAVARPSVVCPSVVCLSVVCLSVTLVRPTQSVEIFKYVSSPFGTLATR